MRGAIGGGAGGATGSSRMTGVSRETRATTPGVNVGVGLRVCAGGAENGVVYGIELREGDGGGAGGMLADGVGARGGGASGAASASDSIIARSAASQPPRAGIAATVAADTGASMPIRITAPQTEQRARTPPGGTFEGSTRKIELHSAHETFTAPPWLWMMRPA
jgi:hypothetical protein